MSTTIDQAFIRQYESEVHVTYQRRGSKLRGTVRTKNGVVGKSTTFPKYGKGEAGVKTRHGLVPVMNIDHSGVEVTLTDYYAGEWIDKLDEYKTNIDERNLAVNAGAYAMGRKTDALILAALATVPGGNVTALSTATAIAFRNSLLVARQELAERDVPTDDGELFAVISPAFESWLMTIPEFTSADYVGAELPYKGTNMRLRTWLDVHWMSHTGLDLATNTRSGYLYHRTAVGHAIGADVQTDITWHGDHAAWFVNNMMSQGAGLIDGNGVQKITLDESQALPTS